MHSRSLIQSQSRSAPLKSWCRAYITASLLELAMLTAIIALIAVLTPLGPSWGPRTVLSTPNDFLVDLGYQLNQGHTVVVARYPLSQRD